MDRLLALAREVQAAKVERTGHNVVLFDAPDGGRWKIWFAKRATSGWDIKIYPPKNWSNKAVYTSISSLEQALNTKKPAENSLESKAAIVIQAAFRVRLLRRMKKKVKDMEENVRKALRTLRCADAMFPKLEYEVTPGIACEVEAVEELLLVTYGITRDMILNMSRDLVQQNTSKKNALNICGKSIQQLNGKYPLFVAPMTLPKGLRSYFVEPTGITVYMNCTEAYISKNHASALETHFNKKWRQHMDHVMSEADNTYTYDAYHDKNQKVYIGSVCVSKHLTRFQGQLMLALCIQSIVCAVKESGGGIMLMDFCRSLMLSNNDPRIQSRGYIFAQCLDVNFWITMDATKISRALNAQLHFIFPNTYGLHSNCIMRSEFCDSALMNAASPEKLKKKKE